MEGKTSFSWSQDKNGDKITITCTSFWKLQSFLVKITEKACNKFQYQIIVCKLAVLPSLYFAKGNTEFPKHLLEESFWQVKYRVGWHAEPTHHVPDDIKIQKIPTMATVVGEGLTLEGALKINTGLQSQYKP